MNVSSIYNDPNRVLMEYIDNSFDAAEQKSSVFKTLSGDKIEYSSDVEIKVEVSGKYYSTGSIKISDNCTGMKELRKVVERIGNSDKKSQPWTNGQFGYGIYSFMSICNTLEIQSKHKDNSYSEYIKISSEDFLIDDLNDLKFEIIKDETYSGTIGTTVILSGFSKDGWLGVDVKKLKREIEDHFELLLKNSDIKVKLKDHSGSSFLCRPFYYDPEQGTIIKKSIPIIVKDKVYGHDIDRGNIEVLLYVTPGKAIDSPTVMISKNRRVIELWQVKSFRTNHKRDLWNHPSVKGYIDTKEFLHPTLARNDFKNDSDFRLIKKAILSVEDEFINEVSEILKTSTTGDFSEIESEFNSSLSSITDFSSTEKRDIKPGDVLKISDSGELKDVIIPDESGPLKTDFGTKTGKSKGKGKGKGKTEKTSELVNSDTSSEFVKFPLRNRESRLSIKIDDSSDPILDNEGNEKRSELFGNTVTIYKKHRDFSGRIKTDTMGIEIITIELISYLASEMLLHYTNLYFQKTEGNDTADKKPVLYFFTDNLYRMEESLKRLINKPLSK